MIRLSACSSSPNNDDRRDFLKQLVCSSAVMMLPTSPAQAGLLDEFGTDPSKITVKEKEVIPPPAGAKKGEVAIDPTLRACKLSFLVLCYVKF